MAATSTGLTPAELGGIVVQVGQEKAVDFMLQAAGNATEITVIGGQQATVDTDSPRIGVNVSDRETANLPLNGRQIPQLYLLTPGSVNSGGGNYDNIRFSGRSSQQNEIRFDGIEGASIVDASPGNLNGETSSAFRLQASLETVQEFRVESNNYPAEFGTGTGGVVVAQDHTQRIDDRHCEAGVRPRSLPDLEAQLRTAGCFDVVSAALRQHYRSANRRRVLLRPRPDRRPDSADRERPNQPNDLVRLAPL